MATRRRGTRSGRCAPGRGSQAPTRSSGGRRSGRRRRRSPPGGRTARAIARKPPPRAQSPTAPGRGSSRRGRGFRSPPRFPARPSCPTAVDSSYSGVWMQLISPRAGCSASIRRDRRACRRPALCAQPLHDAAGAVLGSRVLVLGGGSSQSTDAVESIGQRAHGPGGRPAPDPALGSRGRDARGEALRRRWI